MNSRQVYYELTIAHPLRDGNIIIKHDVKCKLAADRDYDIFTKAGFMVILRKVTVNRKETKGERVLRSQW